MSQSKVTASGGTVRTVGAAPSWESSQENEFAWEGWNIHIHPQGWLYFRDPVARVITDEDIRQPTTLRAVEEYIRTFPITELEEDMELLVPHDPRPDDHTFALAVNHALGLASRHIAEVKPKNLSRAEPHLLSRRKKMYWHFMERHPSHKAVPQGAEEEVKDALTWYHVDNLVAGARSTVPFSKVECEDLLRSLNSTKTDKVFNSPGRTVFLSWLLREIWSFRTSEAYGQYAFKLSSAERIKRIPTGPVPALPPPSIIRIPLRFVVNFLFFAIPNTYQDHVRQAGQYQGRLSTVQYNWERYTRRLVQEYQDFLLIATVLLSATVGFLAIPDIDATGRAAGIVSVFAALGSIIIGVFCIWRHQSNVKQWHSFNYIQNAHHGLFGLMGYSLYLSLPPVLLVWGIIAFAVGFIAYAVQDTTGGSSKGDLAAAWVALGVSIFVLIFVAAGLYTFAVIWKFRSQQSRWFWLPKLRRNM